MSSQDLHSPDDVDTIMADDAGAVLIEFWSSDGPKISDDFDAVAKTFANDPVRFCRVQIDAHPEIAEPFHIETIPTLILALDGEILDAAVGRMDRALLEKKVRWLMSQQRGDGFFARLFGR